MNNVKQLAININSAKGNRIILRSKQNSWKHISVDTAEKQQQREEQQPRQHHQGQHHDP